MNVPRQRRFPFRPSRKDELTSAYQEATKTYGIDSDEAATAWGAVRQIMVRQMIAEYGDQTRRLGNYLSSTPSLRLRFDDGTIREIKP